MEILKRGTLPTIDAMDVPKISVVTCERQVYADGRGCGAILEVEERDLIMMYWIGEGIIGNFEVHYAAIKCPCCNKHNRVNLPDAFWKKFNTTERRAKAIFDGDRDI